MWIPGHGTSIFHVPTDALLDDFSGTEYRLVPFDCDTEFRHCIDAGSSAHGLFDDPWGLLHPI
jgi:hypothetical protein